MSGVRALHAGVNPGVGGDAGVSSLHNLAAQLDAPLFPLVRRHVGDAAFMAMQRLDLVDSRLAGLDDLLRFDRVLQAHVDGLLLAGATAVDEAWSALQRWGGAGEVFVCATLALIGQDGPRLQTLWAQVEAQPQKLQHGFELALMWTGSDPERPRLAWIEHWVQAAHLPPLQACALRAAAACQRSVTDSALQALLSEIPEVRAAGCRALGVEGPHNLQARMLPLLDDPEPEVRAEAAIVLLKLDVKGVWQAAALQALQTALESRLPALQQHSPTRSGAQARRDGLRWLRAYALHLPCGQSAAHFCTRLPAVLGVEFAVWHGDPALLPHVLSLAIQPSLRPVALWGLVALSGVDPDANGLAVPQDSAVAVEVPLDYTGLPALDPQRAEAWWLAASAGFHTGQRWLGGQPLADQASVRQLLVEWLHRAPQAFRRLATEHLGGVSRFDVEARASQQLGQLRLLTEGEP